MTADPILNFGKPVPKADPGTYPAKLVGIQTFIVDEGTPDAKTLLQWEFTLDGTDDPEMPGYETIVTGASSTATGKRSKMRAWVTALYGREMDSAVTLSLLRDTLVGRPCMVAVVINENGYSRVDNVIAAPVRPANAKVLATVAAQAAPTGEDGEEQDESPNDPLPF